MRTILENGSLRFDNARSRTATTSHDGTMIYVAVEGAGKLAILAGLEDRS